MPKIYLILSMRTLRARTAAYEELTPPPARGWSLC
jgi:hypothetical protein